MPPAPAERPPAARQAGRRSPVAESERRHKIRLFSQSWQKMTAILHHGLQRSQDKSSPRRFRFAVMSGTGKNGSLIS
ncbi:hypothetical protein PSI22_20890 [Xenorhabdus sp. XENO-7]|uniref:Uncharacterized protein n=1 Tax=Xenorhabdus aichiensis TaxID=3025874 RepID=A0ABT5M902_9GAMM|nr:hypothetical protein [Xenorhabdus aichiensis]MDC9624017.1 hypothetical protein [Xenorhabdus aichiensis]